MTNCPAGFTTAVVSVSGWLLSLQWSPCMTLTSTKATITSLNSAARLARMPMPPTFAFPGADLATHFPDNIQMQAQWTSAQCQLTPY